MAEVKKTVAKDEPKAPEAKPVRNLTRERLAEMVGEARASAMVK